jgi:hypothetical protein
MEGLEMPGTSSRLLQALLWFVCAFHVIVGVGLNVSDRFPQLMAGYYGANVDWNPQFSYILKPLGVFMFALGILAAAAARKPLGHGIIVYGFVTIFVLRALQRVVLWPEIRGAFEITPGRNFGNAVFFFVLAGLLLGLYRVAARSAPRSA